ncbi:Ig-like domain-containing protein [Acinetobacter baumannii]
MTVTYPDGTTATVVAGTDGTWSVPNPGNLVDGDTVTATATDPAGNTSGPATAVVDAVAPTVALDDVLTNDSTPALTGTVNGAGYRGKLSTFRFWMYRCEYSIKYLPRGLFF